MIPDDELTIVRRVYAKQIVHAARVYAKQIVHAARASDPRLEEALGALRREDFLPPGPWQLMRFWSLTYE